MSSIDEMKDKRYEEIILDRSSKVPFERKKVGLKRKLKNLFSCPQKAIRYYYYAMISENELYGFDGFDHCPCCNYVGQKKIRRTGLYKVCTKCNQKVIPSGKNDFGHIKFWEDRDLSVLQAIPKFLDAEKAGTCE